MVQAEEEVDKTRSAAAGKSSPPLHDHDHDQVDEIIFALTFVAAFALLNLPYDHIKSTSNNYHFSIIPVPRVIFKDKPSLFHAFVLALNFAFTGAVMAICTRQGYPKIARNSRRLAIASAAAALGILTFSAT